MPWIRKSIEEHFGKRFGKLTVIGEYPTPAGKVRQFLCQCDCGQVWNCFYFSVLNGLTTSCGCKRSDPKETFSDKPEYTTWTSMWTRCRNPKCDMYPSYGGRGIKVCARWKQFKNFLADMGLKPSPSHSLDRIDTEGNYEPSNCRWVDWETQQNNRRNNRHITHNGETKTLAQWARFASMDIPTLHYRLKIGLSMQEALSPTPRQKGPKRKYSR